MLRRTASRASWLFVALLLASPLLARAEERDESERWVPAFGVTSGLLGQKVDASVSSGPVSFIKTTRVRSPFPPNNAVITMDPVDRASVRPPVENDDHLLTPFVMGTLELMTPGLQALPGRPRLFAHGDAGGAFGTTHHVARERAPSDQMSINGVPVVPGEPVLANPYFSEEAVAGIGSEVSAEVQPLLVSAGVGVAFSVDLLGRRFRIKPSIEYVREEIDLVGKVNNAFQLDTGINFFPAVPGFSDEIPEVKATMFPVQLAANTTEVFHGLGPGLELEMDASRAGPFQLALFIGAQAYRILGDRKIEFGAQETVDNAAFVPNPQTLTADFSFEKDAWGYRGGVGIRFRWLPESE